VVNKQRVIVNKRRVAGERRVAMGNWQ